MQLHRFWSSLHNFVQYQYLFTYKIVFVYIAVQAQIYFLCFKQKSKISLLEHLCTRHVRIFPNVPRELVLGLDTIRLGLVRVLALSIRGRPESPLLLGNFTAAPSATPSFVHTFTLGVTMYLHITIVTLSPTNHLPPENI